jgi:hypothetical protein
MRLREVTDELTFKEEFLGQHSGQSDRVLYAISNSQEVGHVDYSVYDGVPAIKWIETSVVRRKIATRLLQHLQKLFPDVEIEWGMLTDDGSVLKKSIPFTKLPNKPVINARKKLAEFIQRRDVLAARFDAWEQTPMDDLSRASGLFNQLSDKIEHLERYLYGKKDTIDLIKV